MPSTCILCIGAIEDCWHIFIGCPFAKKCWEELWVVSLIYDLAAYKDDFSHWLFEFVAFTTGIDIDKIVMTNKEITGAGGIQFDTRDRLLCMVCMLSLIVFYVTRHLPSFSQM